MFCIFVFCVLLYFLFCFLRVAPSRWYVVVAVVLISLYMLVCICIFCVSEILLLHIAPARWYIVVAVRLSAAADVDRDRACQLQLSSGTGNYFGTK